MVRSTMLTTDEVGAPVTRLAYTAFGEPVTYDDVSQTWRVGFPAAGGMGGSPVTRYQYAGGFGYETGLITLQGVNPALPPVTLQHVGERWYDPAIGRFVQRDPIGIDGGMNVYAYCANEPLAAADPSGLVTIMHDPGGRLFPGGKDTCEWVYRLLRAERILKLTPAKSPVAAAAGAAWGAATAGGAVTVCILVSPAVFSALNYYHPGTEHRYTDYIGNWFYDWFLKPDDIIRDEDGNLTTPPL